MKLGDYIDKISNRENKEIFKNLLKWTLEVYPNLDLEMKWNQPMFLLEGTFIISYTNAKNHISVGPEKVILEEFLTEINDSGYESSKMLFKINYKDQINYNLLKSIIDRSIEMKKGYKRFWL